ISDRLWSEGRVAPKISGQAALSGVARTARPRLVGTRTGRRAPRVARVRALLRSPPRQGRDRGRNDPVALRGRPAQVWGRTAVELGDGAGPGRIGIHTRVLCDRRIRVRRAGTEGDPAA